MGGESPFDASLKKANRDILRGINDAQKEVGSSYNQQTASLLDGYQTARKDLSTYVGAAIQSGDYWAKQGYDAYTQMNKNFSDPTAAMNNYLNSADYKLFYGGANGAGGDPNKSALERFQESPDYQYRLNSTMDAINRRASAGGYYNDPRLTQELMDQSGKMASQEYGAYNDRLTNNYNTYNTRLGQTAQIGFNAMQGNQQLRAGLGQGLASLSSGYGQQMAESQRWYGEQMANSDLAKGNANGSYSLVKAASQAPSASSATQGWLGKL